MLKADLLSLLETWASTPALPLPTHSCLYGSSKHLGRHCQFPVYRLSMQSQYLRTQNCSPHLGAPYQVGPLILSLFQPHPCLSLHPVLPCSWSF